MRRTNTDPIPPPARRIRLPRLESVFLLLAAAWILGAKLVAVRRLGTDDVVGSWWAVARSDVLFFALVAAIFQLMALARPRALFIRLVMLASAAILAWSVLAAAWLIATGVQLQPGVLTVLANEPTEFSPVVVTHLKQKLLFAIPLIATALAAVAWFLRRLILPSPAPPGDRPVRRIVVLAGLAGVTGVTVLADLPRAELGYDGAVLGFSSHWSALLKTVDQGDADDVGRPTRHLARAGERRLEPQADRDRPNVVIVLLESVSYKASTLGRPDLDPTPTLARLANEGAEFVSTRVPVAYTSKAFWATFTGSTPDVQPDAAESVLADTTYESIASILGREGYRSAFFEMSMGSFECAPGLFWNLGFDHAWFRENLGDPEASIGYFSGDDFRMFDPMFEWVDRGSEPFLLTMITSVSHHPYEVPSWYGELSGDREADYLQSVRFTDDFLAELDARLEARGLTDETILCVLGDHGEDVGPEGHKSRWEPIDAVIRVPWVMRWPGRIEPGTRIEAPASQLDVTPTILTLLGFDVRDADFDGIDALGPIASDRRLYFAAWYANSPRGYVESGRKTVYLPYSDSLWEYDLRADPDESNPVEIDDESERRRRIDAIERWSRDARFFVPATRFRERLLYGHWQAFSSGRLTRAFFIPPSAAAETTP